jgi:hypothetical protein
MRIIFVGIHNKPGLAPLDGSTRSGKLIDGIIRAVDYPCVKTNLYDAAAILKDIPEIHILQLWKDRVEYTPTDIIVALGRNVEFFFKDPEFRTVVLKHPSAVWSNRDKDDYVRNAIQQISTLEIENKIIERAFVAGRSQTSWTQFKSDNNL